MPDAWMQQQGALIGTREGTPHDIARALDAVMSDLGYRTRLAEDAIDMEGVSFQRFEGARGAWALASIDRGVARAIAARLASRSGCMAWLVVAQASYRENVKPACVFDATETCVHPDGRLSPPQPSALDAVTWSDRELDTDKPWRLVQAALDAGIGAWMGAHTTSPRSAWIAPARLSDARLDALSLQIRAGAAVDRVVVGNRRALRVRALDGSTSTAFLSDDELRVLVDACPSLSGGNYF